MSIGSTAKEEEEGRMEDLEQKTQVIEKRLSKGVIRRRVKVEPTAAATPSVAPASQPLEVKETIPVKPKAETKPTPEENVAKNLKHILPSEPEKTVKPTLVKPQEPASLAKQVVEDVAATPPVATQTKKVSPENPVASTQAPAEHTPVKKAAATQVGEEIIKDLDAKKNRLAKKEETENRPLTFQERLRGSISLDKFRPKTPVKKQPAGAQPADAAPGVDEESAAGDEEKKSALTTREKAAKARKVKVIGGDLDIDGLGKSTTLTHLVRTTAMDRVFRPDLMGARKKKIISKKKIKATPITQKKASKRFVEMHGTISVRDLAQQLGLKAGDVIKSLMNLGMTATINETLDLDTATLIAQEHQYEVRDISFKEDSLLQESVLENATEDADAVIRPPVVTIMGHVDHGKTSLLDSIRSTNVTEGEAGGITQHIGAYTVHLSQGDITFLDTPGHEAFTAMRARGAKVTDFVVLVVAADDGVMPQTEESIAHAKAAEVPIIVAVNKMDKPEANPERVMRQLSEKGLLAEEWGGDVLFAKVSAKTKAGIKELLESILLQAEVLELKANPKKRAAGLVLEAKLDKFRGPVCTLLVQEGTLAIGDPVVVGTVCGKIRAMQNWQGKDVKEAGPSHAVEILGLESIPEAGDNFNVVASEQDARTVAAHRIEEKAKAEREKNAQVKLEDMFSKMKAGEVLELNVVLKTDVQGSLEAVRDAINKLGTAEVKTKVIHAAVGGIKETDINLASASKAVIIGFNVRPETKAIGYAKEKGVDIKLYKIIYDLVNDVKLAMQGLLAPTLKENYLGRAEVRETFQVSKMGLVAGCMVVDGSVTRNANIRLLRDNVVIHEGKIGTLKRFKDDAREVKQGFECGIGIEGYQDIKPGDLLEAYTIEEIQRTL